MFRNHSSRRAATLVVTMFLLAALPAAAGSATPIHASRGAGTWQGLVARVLAWLSHPWDATSALAANDSSANIDPLGQH